ncbi:MAG: DegV family protein [Brevinema sp.]
MSTLTSLTAKEFYWSVLSGGKKLIEHQEEINKINVYPVPDADTGSNMAATASSVIYNSKEEGSIKDVAESIGNAALDGARGNSGVIFAQFLYALGREMKENPNLTITHFADIVGKASKYVYEAVPHPQEGTILTVIREWADNIIHNSVHSSDFEDLFMKAEIKAQESLEKTARQLEAMRLAKVVDAGAKGFVVFIQGMKEALNRRAFTREDHDMEHLMSVDIDMPIAEAETLTEDSLHNRFCTEACLIGTDINKTKVLEILEKQSDSIVVAGGDTKLRVHFHTNHPEEVMDELRTFGRFSFQKVEDMRQQYNVTHHRKHKIALIVDSGVALGFDFAEQEQVHIVPLTVEFPEGTYLDGRTVTLETVNNRIKTEGSEGKSSQPSPKSFADVYGYVSHYYDSAIVLTISAGVSGTHNSALQALRLAKFAHPDFRIDVVDSGGLNASAGVVAHAVAKDIRDGLSHDEVIARIKDYANNTETYVNFKGIDHMIRSGRLGPYAGHILKLFKLSPAITIAGRKAKVVGAGIGIERSLKKSLKTIKKHLEEGRKPIGFVCSHLVLDDPKTTELLDTYLRRISYMLEMEPWSVNYATPAMIPNVGMSAIGLGILWDKPGRNAIQ